MQIINFILKIGYLLLTWPIMSGTTTVMDSWVKMELNGTVDDDPSWNDNKH